MATPITMLHFTSRTMIHADAIPILEAFDMKVISREKDNSVFKYTLLFSKGWTHKKDCTSTVYVKDDIPIFTLSNSSNMFSLKESGVIAYFEKKQQKSEIDILHKRIDELESMIKYMAIYGSEFIKAKEDYEKNKNEYLESMYTKREEKRK